MKMLLNRAAPPLSFQHYILILSGLCQISRSGICTYPHESSVIYISEAVRHVFHSSENEGTRSVRDFQSGDRERREGSRESVRGKCSNGG